jgi:hypothetical protein
MAKPAHETNQDETREEVIRALLDPGHEEADELGRTPPDADGTDTATHASPREQAAAPINILKVDE